MKDNTQLSEKTSHEHESTHEYSFDYEGKTYPSAERFVTAAQVKTQVGQPSDIPLVLVLGDESQRILADSDQIDLKIDRKLKRLPRFRRGGPDRLEEEFAALIAPRYPGAVLRKGERIVEILGYQLPPGLYNAGDTTLAIVVTAAYPEAPPDNFFTEPGLRFRDGRALSNYSDGVVIGGRVRGQFSWHVDGNGWRPSADIGRGDNLLTYLSSVRSRIQEGN